MVRPSALQPGPATKQEAEIAANPVTPQPDRQAVAIEELDAFAKESIEIAETVLQDFPSKSEPLGLIGMVYNRCGQTAKAVGYWEQALDRDPNRPDLYDAMVTVALRKGEYEKAAVLCRKGLGLSAQMPHLHGQLVEALNGLGCIEESVSELQTATRLFPENGEFHRRLANAYAMLNEDRKAKSCYETAVKLQPRSASAHYGLALACAKLGLEDQSTRAMEQFQRLKAESFPAQRDPRGVADDALNGRRNLAITCADAGTIYIDNGMPEKAEPLLRRGAEVDPNNLGCRIQLKQILLQHEPGDGDRSYRP